MSDGLTEASRGFESYKRRNQIPIEPPRDKEKTNEGVDKLIKSSIERTTIFRVRVDKLNLTDSNIVTDPDGFIYISTNNPSFIFEKLGTDNVLSIEKISSGYIIK
mgnify:CR=1 FL=1